MFLFCLVFTMSLCASVYICFVVTCWERADLLALVCGVYWEFVTFPLVSWVRCGTWLYRFLIFAPLLTLFSQAVSWYCLIYFGYSPKMRISIFRVNYIYLTIWLKNLKFLFLVHGLSFDILEKIKKKYEGHLTNYLSGGPNSTLSTQISKK